MKGAKNTGSGSVIIEQDGKRILAVSSTDDLKIISSPQRQQILKILRAQTRPLHGKEIADLLGIKAPSAHFHLSRLEQLGAVRLSHTQMINGITARYYAPAVDDIVLGDDFLKPSDNKTLREKLILSANTFDTAKKTFLEALQKKLRSPAKSEPGLMLLLNEVVSLSGQNTEAFSKELTALLAKYSAPLPDAKPYALFFSLSEMEQPGASAEK